MSTVLLRYALASILSSDLEAEEESETMEKKLSKGEKCHAIFVYGKGKKSSDTDTDVKMDPQCGSLV